MITLTTLMVYGTAQHLLRIGANAEPATQAKFLSQRLANGAEPAEIVTSYYANLPQDGATFTLITDENEKTIISTYRLNNQLLELPSGVYSYAKSHGEDRLTWQPEMGIREATVVMPYTSKDGKTGFVASGVSLRESENSLDALTLKLFMGWVLMMAVSSITFYPGVSKKS